MLLPACLSFCLSFGSLADVPQTTPLSGRSHWWDRPV